MRAIAITALIIATKHEHPSALRKHIIPQRAEEGLRKNYK